MLRAFANRQAPKDAFDMFHTLLHNDGGTEAAVRAMAREEQTGNPAGADATRCLAQHFADASSSAPIRAANFVFGELGSSVSADARLLRQQLRQQVVDAGRLMLQGVASTG